MQTTLHRVLLAVLALTTLWPGVWAVLGPRSFYYGFPGFGRVWVAVDGPFNEHLVRDVGAFFLALGVLAIGALLVRSMVAARLTAAAFLVFGVPHAIYHFTHLDVYGTVDATLNVVGQALFLAAAAVVLVLPARPVPTHAGG